MEINVKYLQSRLSYNKRNNKIWENVSSMGDLTVDFVRQFKDRLYWEQLSWNKSI